jgi:flagellar hook-length control protein FliK
MQQQGNTQLATNTDQTGMQPGDLLQAAAGVTTGYSFNNPAKAPDSLPASGTSTQTFSLNGAELRNDTLQGIETLPGKFGRGADCTPNAEGDAAVLEANGDIQASRDNLSSWSKGVDSGTEGLFRPEADVSSWGAAPASQMQSRSSGESPGNGYQAAKGDAELFGKNDVSSVPVNVTQGKQSAGPDSTTATVGITPDQVKVIFAQEQGANQKDLDEARPFEPLERKTADNASTPAFVTNPAESRTSGESNMASPSPEAEKPLGDHITSQIREQLDSGSLASNNGQITVKLHPEELGELKISMRMENQHLKVEITAQNPTVKDALMQNLDTLKETLSRQNISMDRFDVSTGAQQESYKGGRDEKQMAQDNGVNNNSIPRAGAMEEDVAPKLQYNWENEDSLVNLLL